MRIRACVRACFPPLTAALVHHQIVFSHADGVYHLAVFLPLPRCPVDVL